MRTLATGTTGRIGSHLGPQVMPISINLGSSESVREIEFESTDSIIHLASIVGEKAVATNPEHSFAVNVSGAEQLANRFLECSSGIFLYVSTAHVYGKSERNIKEDDPLNPQSLYAQQKCQAEERLKSLFRDDLTRLRIIRVFSVLDWNLGGDTLGEAIEKLTLSLTRGVLAYGNDVRDFLTPKTISQALIELVKIKKSEVEINLCSGVGISVGEAAQLMLWQKGITLTPECINYSNSWNPRIVGDPTRLNSLITKELRWDPNSGS